MLQTQEHYMNQQMDLLYNPLTSRPNQTGCKTSSQPYPNRLFGFIDYWDCQYGNISIATRTQTTSNSPHPSLIGTVSYQWHWVGMDIRYIPKTDDGYPLLVAAMEYLRWWPEAWPLKQGTSKMVAHFFREEAISRLATPESVVVDGGAENTILTYLLLKWYNIRKSSVTTRHATTTGVFEWGHRLIATAPSPLSALSAEQTVVWIDHLVAVLWPHTITGSLMTGYSPFRLMFGQDAVLLTELENSTSNSTNRTQGIGDTASQIAPRVKEPEPSWEHIDPGKHSVKQSKDANKCYFNQAADLQADDLHNGHLDLLHKTKIELSYSANVEAMWGAPYRVTDIAQCLETYPDGWPRWSRACGLDRW